ncbi:MAG: hypothetical protein ACI97A_001360 [Planctomycetota bacterium]|jgi:hypothetical protein
MKSLIPIAVGMLVTFLVYAGWVAFIEDGGTKVASSGDREQTGKDKPGSSDYSGKRGSDSNRAKNQANLPDWLKTGGIQAANNEPTRPDGLPVVIGELEFLTFGRDKHVVNGLPLKSKLNELRLAMAEMTPDEEKLLADYFRNSQDPTLKYYLMISFRSWGGEPYVEAIADYYEAEPEMVAESLQHLMGRTPTAVAAMDRLIENEIDPLRRANLIGRAGMLGAPGSDKIMMRLFGKEGTVDRRQSIAGMAKAKSEETHEQLLGLIDGDYEAAIYLPNEKTPDDKEMMDLRCHAVVALLSFGSEEEVDRLLDRSLKNQENDQIASYVEKYFYTVRNTAFVPKIVDRIVAQDEVPLSLVLYLGARSEKKDVPQLERLLALDLDDKKKEVVQAALSRLR